MKLIACVLLVKIGETKKEAGRVSGLLELQLPIRASRKGKS
jgi:hypothetical protein